MALSQRFLVQKPMMRVVYALIPLVLASIYFFGWRSLVLTFVVLIFGIGTEALFTIIKGKPVTSAVLVTCLIFSLSLPPTVPLWIGAVGIVAGVALGKMMFGGFGLNVFNPAMVGRCFIYITFPLHMTHQWVESFREGWGGLPFWTGSVDSLTSATPLEALREGGSLPWFDLVLGRTAGSLGETSALLILLGGLFIIIKKAASWRLALSCLLGGVICTLVLRAAGVDQIPTLLSTLTAGVWLSGISPYCIPILSISTVGQISIFISTGHRNVLSADYGFISMLRKCSRWQWIP